MHWLTGSWSHLGTVGAKATLMYLVALLGLRLGERRTLAQWTLIDFATAVAMGAIIGRTAIAATQSFVIGAVALLTLIVVHRLVSLARFSRGVGKLVDHRVRVLVLHGAVRERELRLCAITHNDLYAQLRQRGIFSLENIRYVLYESKGAITVVREGGDVSEDPELVAIGIRDAVNYP